MNILCQVCGIMPCVCFKPPVISNDYQRGWECPRCHAVMAPSAPMCLYCKPDVVNGQITDSVTSNKEINNERD